MMGPLIVFSFFFYTTPWYMCTFLHVAIHSAGNSKFRTHHHFIHVYISPHFLTYLSSQEMEVMEEVVGTRTSDDVNCLNK